MRWITRLAVIAVPFLLGLSQGDRVPDFSAKNQDGKVIHFDNSYEGKFVLFYFYPKDDTPGCTKEACNFRDEFSKLKKLNTVVFGVSRQDETSHLSFRSKHHLPFDLLVDEDGKISKLLGVGSIPILGLTKRQSVLVGPDRKVIRFYNDVDPSTHVQEIIKDIEKAPQSLPPKNLPATKDKPTKEQ